MINRIALITAMALIAAGMIIGGIQEKSARKAINNQAEEYFLGEKKNGALRKECHYDKGCLSISKEANCSIYYSDHTGYVICKKSRCFPTIH